MFFKTCKSVLRLTKECRSLSYDAMCAQTAIVFMRYMFLAVGVREDGDLRSSEPLFCLAADEIADISFAAAFEKLQLFLQKLLEGFITQKEEICALDFLTLTGGLSKTIQMNSTQTDRQDNIFKKRHRFHAY